MQLCRAPSKRPVAQDVGAAWCPRPASLGLVNGSRFLSLKSIEQPLFDQGLWTTHRNRPNQPPGARPAPPAEEPSAWSRPRGSTPSDGTKGSEPEPSRAGLSAARRRASLEVLQQQSWGLESANESNEWNAPWNLDGSQFRVELRW